MDRPNIDLSMIVTRELPYLRRYGRALTGSQDSGDTFAAATIEAVLQDTDLLLSKPDPVVGLFHIFHRVWASAGAPLGDADTRLSQVAQSHMLRLTPNSREALLLHTIEGFNFSDIAVILDKDEGAVRNLLDHAVTEMKDAILGDVLVIEDEAIIAMDISSIVEMMGHTVIGNARTHAEAVALAAHKRPDLILADIQLADQSSGVDAVNDILARAKDIPVIFITAFPERLLTGLRPEPAFLINKPYTEEQLRSAISQAMFFSSTETLS